MSLRTGSVDGDIVLMLVLCSVAIAGLGSFTAISVRSPDSNATLCESPDPENVTVVKYLGAVQEVTDAEVICTYGGYFRSGVKEVTPVSDGTRLVIVQSAHGLAVTTDLEKYASLYSERDLKNLAADVQYDLERHAAARTDHARRNTEEKVETPIYSAENQ